MSSQHTVDFWKTLKTYFLIMLLIQCWQSSYIAQLDLAMQYIYIPASSGVIGILHVKVR